MFLFHILLKFAMWDKTFFMLLFGPVSKIDAQNTNKHESFDGFKKFLDLNLFKNKKPM